MNQCQESMPKEGPEKIPCMTWSKKNMKQTAHKKSANAWKQNKNTLWIMSPKKNKWVQRDIWIVERQRRGLSSLFLNKNSNLTFPLFDGVAPPGWLRSHWSSYWDLISKAGKLCWEEELHSSNNYFPQWSMSEVSPDVSLCHKVIFCVSKCTRVRSTYLYIVSIDLC